ncbi:hypothetical protein DUNSADRAFT_7778 [Dunaliella salina]|uniref:Uncharacterized protein n=1 Tax=Dunaliella salina TaxID=3046 RepID=A0ABQ7GKQ4_DUNSA|nr:hypothetical protein DUNSADRAFT_7778 [Dunaliella salina]|eukprot:KAF5835188.1 hypothetical protein DUNSADRAFT_7778 [Dunaliella salina]
MRQCYTEHRICVLAHLQRGRAAHRFDDVLRDSEQICVNLCGPDVVPVLHRARRLHLGTPAARPGSTQMCCVAVCRFDVVPVLHTTRHLCLGTPAAQWGST